LHKIETKEVKETLTGNKAYRTEWMIHPGNGDTRADQPCMRRMIVWEQPPAMTEVGIVAIKKSLATVY
jgi:hypothetical protein